jgi:GAF domain-containing protein
VLIKTHHGRTVGVLQVLNKRTGYFTLDDEGMLSALASEVGVSLENSKLFLSVVGKNMELLETKERLEQKVRELDVLFEIAQVSASAARLDELLEGVLARAMHAIAAEAGSILLSDTHSGELRFRCAIGGDPEAVKRLTIAADQGICGWVWRHDYHQPHQASHGDAIGRKDRNGDSHQSPTHLEPAKAQPRQAERYSETESAPAPEDVRKADCPLRHEAAASRIEGQSASSTDQGPQEFAPQ